MFSIKLEKSSTLAVAEIDANKNLSSNLFTNLSSFLDKRFCIDNNNSKLSLDLDNKIFVFSIFLIYDIMWKKLKGAKLWVM